jgi:hypothetical protein
MAVRNTIFMGLIGPVAIAAYVPKWRAIPITAVALAVATLSVFDIAPALAAGNVIALRAAEWQLPSGAAYFIEKRQIRDRMFNGYETGGYLVWRLPLRRDFIDPRGLSEEVYADYKRILRILARRSYCGNTEFRCLSSMASITCRDRCIRWRRNWRRRRKRICSTAWKSSAISTCFTTRRDLAVRVD